MQNLIRINWHRLRGQGRGAPVPFSNCAFSFRGLFWFQGLFLAALGHWGGVVAAAGWVFLVLFGVFVFVGVSGRWVIVWWSFEIFLIFSNFLRFYLKSFGNSWGDVFMPRLSLIITFHFTCGENLVKYQNVLKYYAHDCIKAFFWWNIFK